MALCHITGTLFIPDGSEAANRRIQFQKLATDVVTDDYAGAVVPEVIPTKTDANGDVDVYLITGYYVGTVLDRRGNRSYTFKATVPDQATANLSDLINSAIPVEPIPAWLQEAWAARDAAEAEADRAEVAAADAEGFADAAADSADDAQDSADAAANSASSILGLPLVRYDAQTLTGAQQDQVKSNVEAVGYAPQTLTTAQQGQARANIDAGTFQWNWVINGDFTVNQRGGVKKPANGVYGYDRWKGNANGIEQVVEALPGGEYTLTWSGGGNGTFGGVTAASPIKATVSGGNTSIVVPEVAIKVSLVAGDATAEADPFSPRHIQQELALCQRYFYKMSPTSWRLSGTTTGDIGFWHQFPIPMRNTPAVQSQGVSYDVNAIALEFKDMMPAGFRSAWTSGNSTIHSVVTFGFAADAEI